MCTSRMLDLWCIGVVMFVSITTTGFYPGCTMVSPPGTMALVLGIYLIPIYPPLYLGMLLSVCTPCTPVLIILACIVMLHW